MKAELREKIATSLQNTFVVVNVAATIQEMAMDFEKSQKQGKAIIQSKATPQTIMISKQSGQSQQANNKRKQEEHPYEKYKNCGRMGSLQSSPTNL